MCEELSWEHAIHVGLPGCGGLIEAWAGRAWTHTERQGACSSWSHECVGVTAPVSTRGGLQALPNHHNLSNWSSCQPDK